MLALSLNIESGVDMGVSDKSLVSIHNLKKYYPVTGGIFRKQIGTVKAIDGINLEIFRGETLGLVGESGCGKSTLGRLLLRLERPTEGSVFFEGKDIFEISRDELRQLRRRMQVIFQDPYSSLNPRQTVGRIIGEGLVIHNIGDKAEREERVREIMKVVGLRPEHMNRYPHEFSGGQRQRICIARALILNPEFVICDEPVSALDVSIQAQVINLLLDLQERYNLTYLFISHDLSVVRYMCNRVAVMYLGKLVELANKENIFSEPLHPYTQVLLEAIPKVEPDRTRKRRKLKGDLPSPLNPPPGCTFHPRCPSAFDRCKREIPDFVEVKSGHFVRCFLY